MVLFLNESCNNFMKGTWDGFNLQFKDKKKVYLKFEKVLKSREQP